MNMNSDTVSEAIEICETLTGNTVKPSPGELVVYIQWVTSYMVIAANESEDEDEMAATLKAIYVAADVSANYLRSDWGALSRCIGGWVRAMREIPNMYGFTGRRKYAE